MRVIPAGGRAVQRLRATIFATTMLASLPAAAQVTIPPPVRQSMDANGVDLLDGKIELRGPVLSIGQGKDALVYYQIIPSTMGRANLETYLQRGFFGGAAGLTVVYGDKYAHFSQSGSLFTSTEGDGATLTLSGNIYTFTGPEGTVILFNRLIGKHIADDASLDWRAYATTVTQANGYKLTFTYDQYQCYPGQSAADCNSIKFYRIRSVGNNFGYRMDFSYKSNNYSDRWDWYDLARVDAVNNSVGVMASQHREYGFSSLNFTYYHKLTDSLNRQTIFSTDFGNNLVSVERPGSLSPDMLVAHAGFGGAAKVYKVTTGAGDTMYSSTEAGDVYTTTVTDPLSHATIYKFSLTSQRMTSMTDAAGGVTTYQYDDKARLTQVAYPEGNLEKYVYDARGNVTEKRSVAKPGSGLADVVLTAGYDASCISIAKCNKPNWTRDAKGNQTDYTYDSTTGNLLTSLLPAAVVGGTRPMTTFSHATVGGVSVISGISRCQTDASCAGTADEVKTSIAHNANGLPITVTEGNGSGSLAVTTTAGYDGIGNRTSLDGPLAGTDDTSVYRYNAGRELTGVVDPDPDGAGARKLLAIRNGYDAKGRVILAEMGTVIDASDTAWNTFASQQQVATTFDTIDRPLTRSFSAGGTTYSSEQYSYDHQRLDQVKQVMGGGDPDRIVKYGYDAMDRQTKVTSAFGTAQQADESTATYTANGRVAAVTDAEGNKTSYEYDGHDRLAKTVYPSTTKGSGVSNASDYEQSVYDANGNVTSRRLRDGTSIAYSFDNLDRPTKKDLPGTEPDITYAYDLLGRSASTAQGSQTLSFTHDALGRNLTQVGPQGTVTYGYDAAGRRTSMIYPGSALTINYDYDVTGNVLKIRENGATSGVGILASYAYDDLGRRTSVTFGNGSVQSFGYDPVSRLSTLTNDLGGSATTHDLTQTFGYNPAGQKTSVTRNNDAYAWQAHYNVDRSYAINGLNRIANIGAATFGYDGRGNLTSDGTNSFTYSAENLLKTGPGGATLGYDPLGRLYETVKAGATTRLLYDGTNAVGEYDGSNAVERRYVHGPGIDNPIVWYEGSAISATTRRFLMADERGSVLSVTDSAGATLGLNKYDEYGIPASTNIGKFGYTGQRWLPEIGMWYYKARVYSPTLGRFMQTDPIGYNDGLNWYNYAGSDPVNKVDPSGTIIVVTGTGSGVGSNGGASLGLEMNSLGLGLNAFMMQTPPPPPPPAATKPKKDKDKKLCADINSLAAETRGNLPDHHANSWRYNDVAALRYDRAMAQYALNEANILASATSWAALGLGGGALRWEALGSKGFTVLGVGISAAGIAASAEVNMRQGQVDAYNARLQQLQAQADGIC